MGMIEPVHKPRIVTWMGTVYTINVGNYESGGIVSVFESLVPAGGGPPLHIHHNEDEVIHILEGEYEFWIDGETRRCTAGTSVFLVRGVPHTFRVCGQMPGRNLTVLTPGGLEEFFIEAAAGDLCMPTHMIEITTLAERYGIEFRGPATWRD